LSEEDKAEDWSLAYSYGKKLSRRQEGQLGLSSFNQASRKSCHFEEERREIF
jgi:hypothetical protein